MIFNKILGKLQVGAKRVANQGSEDSPKSPVNKRILLQVVPDDPLGLTTVVDLLEGILGLVVVTSILVLGLLLQLGPS